MAVSAYFEQVIQFDQTDIVDEFTQRTTGLVFEKEASGASVEARCWSSANLQIYDKTLSRPGQHDQHQGLEQLETPELRVIDLDLAKLSHFIQATQSDFRVFYLRQRNSHSRLKVTKEVYKTIVEECQVFPKFLEFVVEFHWKTKDTEFGPPPSRFRLLSGLGYECAYVVRYIEFTNRPRRPPWSLRQFAVYHKYMPRRVAYRSTWVLVGASQRTESSLDKYLRGVGEITEVHPFELHIIFLSTAVSSWRVYLRYLSDQVAEISDTAVAVMIGNGAENGKEPHYVPEGFVAIKLEDFNRLKRTMDRISDVLVCLDSTTDTLRTILDTHNTFFAETQRSADCDQQSPHLDGIANALTEKLRDIALARKKAEALLTKAQSTQILITSLFGRSNGYNLDRQMATLNDIEKQAGEENAIMRHIAEKTSQDSSSVRVLTILTLVYLPCTVVSGFYSTQFVDRKEAPEGRQRIEYTKNTWIFFAMTVPLTVGTLLVWYLWSNASRVKRLWMRRGRGQRGWTSGGRWRKRDELPQ